MESNKGICQNLQGKELAVCEYMSANNGINRFEATTVGDWCLNTTISILRKKGVNIRDEFEKVPTRWGKDAHVKRYFLVSTTQK